MLDSVFATWIGHPEKTAAWRLLKAVRDAIADAGGERPPSLLLAEGSDWFWWLGDDNPTDLAPLYDRIFRAHLADACQQAGIASPVDLSEPLKTRTRPIRVPVSDSWPAPTLDGRMTSYFEWSIATWVESGSSQPLHRLAVWGGRDTLHVLVEGRSRLKRVTSRTPLQVRLIAPDGRVVEPSETIVDAVAEISLPWDPTPGWRLEVRLGRHRLPEESVLVLEPFPVDENNGSSASSREEVACPS